MQAPHDAFELRARRARRRSDGAEQRVAQGEEQTRDPLLISGTVFDALAPSASMTCSAATTAASGGENERSTGACPRCRRWLLREPRARRREAKEPSASKSDSTTQDRTRHRSANLRSVASRTSAQRSGRQQRVGRVHRAHHVALAATEQHVRRMLGDHASTHRDFAQPSRLRHIHCVEASAPRRLGCSARSAATLIPACTEATTRA